MNEKGVLTYRLEEYGGEVIDDMINAPWYLEPLDGYLATQTLRGIDDNYGDKVPEPYKTQIRERLDEIVMEQNYEEAVKKGFAFIDSIIDIPGFTDEEEALIFQGLARIIIGMILKKKKKELKK